VKPHKLPLLAGTKKRLCCALVAVALFPLTAGLGQAQTRIDTDGAILRQNQDVINAQGVGAAVDFMNKGAVQCDENGENCRSLFGADDSFDVGSAQSMAQKTLGTNSFSFLGPEDDANNVATQIGDLVLLCGDDKPHTVAGIAFKATSCFVTESGDTRISFQVCSAPLRSLPVSNPEDAVDCSDDADYQPAWGQRCIQMSCDSEPEGSFNGWSAEKTLHWQASLSEEASDEEKQNNGLGLVFYPDLASGVVPSFSADSDTMTAVKVIETFLQPQTGQQAVGLRVAFRHKTQLTKDMLVDGASSVHNPGSYTAQWANMESMMTNPLVPEFSVDVAQNSTTHLQEIHAGLASDGEVRVLNPNYQGELSGIKPIELSAKIAGSEQDCGTAMQCIREVVNTNSWTHTCHADVPLSTRSCSTVTDYIMEDIHSKRTRSTDMCTERRTVAEHSCNVTASPENCMQGNMWDQGGVDFSRAVGGGHLREIGRDDASYSRKYRFGTPCDNCWGTGYYSTSFDVEVLSSSNVDQFRIYHADYDDQLYIQINGTWIWYHKPDDFFFNTEKNQWGGWWIIDPWVRKERVRKGGGRGPWASEAYYVWRCTRRGRGDEGGSVREYPDSEGCPVTKIWRNAVEWSTSWHRSLNLDLRPYLKEGRNTIRIDVGVVGGGEGWIDFEISGWSTRCTTVVQNECATYEAAK